MPNPNGRNRTQYPICCELAFFFTHFAMCSATDYGFTQGQMQRIIAYHELLLTTTIIDSFCKHWPQEIKEKLANEFLRNLSMANAEYAECSLFPVNNEISGPQCILGRMAARVAGACDRSDEVNFKSRVVKVAIDGCDRMCLGVIFAELGQVVDSASNERLPFFWTDAMQAKKAS